jgi:omega-6 fatty acid desaturase (delta-12 desaturase)
MAIGSKNNQNTSSKSDWFKNIARFEKPTFHQSTWQIINSLIPYLALWFIMLYAMKEGYPYWIILLLAVPTGLFMVRLFILFHDCTHWSFFSSKRANSLFGFISGILTFTPYAKWQASHWRHHATVGDLDRRGSGDFWTMTKEEYLEAPKWLKLVYRLARNPFVMFVLGPIFVFLVAQRLPIRYKTKSERNNIYLTNLIILGVVAVIGYFFGFLNFLLVLLPIVFVGGMLGFWLFYIQHNYEGMNWIRHEEWDRKKASLESCSFYKLPKVLQWFTGSIGFHHVHHLRPMIPNYRLEECHNSETVLKEVEPLTIGQSLRALNLHLWDEYKGKLIGFREPKMATA